MTSIPRLSDSGAAQLMDLLVARGYFKRDGHESIIVKISDGRRFATLSHLCGELASSCQSAGPASLIDAADAASKLNITIKSARKVLSSMESTKDVEVHAVKPSQPHVHSYEADCPLVIVSRALIDQSFHDEKKRLMSSVNKALSLSCFVDTIFILPDHISPAPSPLQLDAQDMLRSLLHERFISDPQIISISQQQDSLLLPTDYMSTARFPLAFREALGELKQPTLVSEVLSQIDMLSELRPDLNWIIERIDAENVHGRFTRSSSRNNARTDQQQIFVPACYVKATKEQILSEFAAHDLWTRKFSVEEAHIEELPLITPQEWIVEAHPNAVVLANAVVGEQTASKLREAIFDCESWHNLQPLIPVNLDDEDTTILLNESLCKSDHLGTVVVSNGHCLFMSSKMIQEIRSELVEPLTHSFAKARVKDLLSNSRSSAKTNDFVKHEKRRKGRGHSGSLADVKADGSHADTTLDILPRQDVVEAVLVKYTDIAEYIHESGEEGDRRAVIDKICLRSFYSDSGSESSIEDLCHMLIQKELKLLNAEQVKTVYGHSSNLKDTAVSFEDPRCFATACYMIQLMASFVEHFESTLDKDDPTDMSNLEHIRQDFLQGICADFARRLTMFCLQKYDWADCAVEFVGQNTDCDIANYSAPIDVASHTFPSVRLTCRPSLEEPPSDDPLKVLRNALDTTVGKSVSRMWTLLGGECYGRGFKTGDLDGFLSHVKDECIVICGLPFKSLDKKAKKHLLNDRRQLLIQSLENETDPKRILDFSIMHLFQHVKQHVVFGRHLGGAILHCLVQERKVTEDLSSALLDLATLIESGDDVNSEKVDLVKALSLGKS